MAAMISLVLLYTILGGMFSVVVTDYVQFILLSVSMLFVCAYSISVLGWQPLVDTVKTVHGAAGFDPFDQDGFGITYVLWMMFTFRLVSCAIWPTAVMRVLAARDEVVVRRIYTWSSIGFMTRFIIPQFIGICALTWLWQQNHDTYFDSQGVLIAGADESFKSLPRYLAWLLPTGLIGLLAAGMLAAEMSTQDSYLLCWATRIVEDVINPLTGGRLSMRMRLLLSRIMIFLIGVFLLAWSIWYPRQQDMLDYLAVGTAIYFTGIIALLVFGLYWKKASRAGAYAALIAGTSAVVGLTPVREMLHVTNADLGFTITEAQIALTSVALSMSTMIFGSLRFPDHRETVSTEVV